MVKFKTALIRFHLSMEIGTLPVLLKPLTFMWVFCEIKGCSPFCSCLTRCACAHHWGTNMWVQSRSGKKICHTVPTCSVLMSYPTLCDPMDGGRQDPLSIGFSRQNYWSRLLFPPPGNLPDPGIEPTSPVSDIGRQILHQLSYQGSPPQTRWLINNRKLLSSQ